MVSLYLGLCILALLLLILMLWLSVFTSSGNTEGINVYYWSEDPLEVNAIEALQYLQNNPGVTGNYLMNNVALIPFTDARQLNKLLRTAIDAGALIAITTTGTPLLEDTFPILIEKPRFQLLNIFSTANISKPPNVIRFAIPDQITLPYAVQVMPPNTIIYYDPDNGWAVLTANYFETQGYTKVSYGSTGLPENVPYMIVAHVITPLLIESVPASIPKLYGLDGSAFYPLEGTVAEKAIGKNFECLTYSPEITSPLIPDVEAAIGKQVNYIFPTTLDAIGYTRNYMRGWSNNTIQTTTTGFTGSLVMENNNRRYGNLAWYQYESTGWILKQKIILNDAGTCTITE